MPGYTPTRKVDRITASLFARGFVLPRERLIVKTAVGNHICWRYLKDDQVKRLHEASTPLPGPERKLGDAEFRTALTEVFAEQNLKPNAMASV